MIFVIPAFGVVSINVVCSMLCGGYVSMRKNAGQDTEYRVHVQANEKCILVSGRLGVMRQANSNLADQEYRIRQGPNFCNPCTYFAF